tara:strand:- start:514 stop:1050 length:537 start_codon:yes stop_codon:yes gene_type:complete
MSAYRQAMLASSVKAEQDKENIRIQDAYDVIADDQETAADWGLWAGILGGLIGFGLGGFSLAKSGFQLGSGFGSYIAPEEFEESMLDIDSGLFGTDDIVHLKADVLSDLDAYERAQELNLISGIFSAGMGIEKQYGSLGNAWSSIFPGSDEYDILKESYDYVEPSLQQLSTEPIIYTG